MAGTRVNCPPPFLSRQRTDRHFVGRDGELYRQDLSAVRGGLVHRHGIKIVKPTASDFGTWVNQGTATLADAGNAMRIESAHAGTTFRFNAALRTLPSGNWDVQIGCRKRSMFKNYHFAGIILRESATGKAETFMWMNRGLISAAWANATAYQGDRNSQFEFHNQLWFRGQKFSATQWAWYFSLDGSLWCHFDTNAITNFLTTAPDQSGHHDPAGQRRRPEQPVRHGCLPLGGRHRPRHQRWRADLWKPGGTGDRTSLITVTTDVTLGDGTINNLVDGGFNNDATDALTPDSTANQASRLRSSSRTRRSSPQAKWLQNAKPKRTGPGSGEGQTTA